MDRPPAFKRMILAIAEFDRKLDLQDRMACFDLFRQTERQLEMSQGAVHHLINTLAKS
jgi:hypothetical protein